MLDEDWRRCGRVRLVKVKVCARAYMCLYVCVCVHVRMCKPQWVFSEGASSRNSMLAGRTGTRCNEGRPQVRWEHGISLAREVLNGRNTTQKGGNAMSISSRIKNALKSIAQSVQHVRE